MRDWFGRSGEDLKTNEKVERVGIFGGTFAPPHNGHVYTAKIFVSEMKLDRLIVIPTYIPPHKQMDEDDDPEIRLEMTKAAFSSVDKAEVSDYEIKKENVSYTVDTLNYFADASLRIYLYCGTDMFLTFETWKRYEDIMKLAHIVCMRRDASDEKMKLLEKKEEYEKKYGASVTILDARPYPAASTDIRGKISHGEDVSDLIPYGVYEIIKKYNLYAGAD